MNDRGEAQKREAQKKEDASRCPGCNHPQGFCTCPKAGGGDGSTGKSGTKEEKTQKLDTIPQWQSDLIKQIANSMTSYYCLPFEENKDKLSRSLFDTFEVINAKLKKDGVDIDQIPASSKTYNIFLQDINKALEAFDSHLYLDYRPEFIAEVKRDNKIVSPDEGGAPKFDLGDEPPEKQLFEWNRSQVEDPRKNYGFIDDPNIRSLQLMSDSPIGKTISSPPTYSTTPTYILSTDGLYFVQDPNKQVSIDDLIVSNRNESAYTALWETLGKTKVPYDAVLHPDEQKAITTITGHIPHKEEVPSNFGYLKINYLLEPHFGSSKGEEYQLGPNTIKKLNEIMKKFEGKDGVILDLRNAPQGGSAALAHYIMSFFVAQKGMKTDEILDRRFSKPDEYFITETPSRLFDMPVAILTDKTTFSAREAIAFHFQQLNKKLHEEYKQDENRFQVIGDVTRGGAHPTYSFPLANESGVNKDLILWLPCAASTIKDWEKVGIIPDKQIGKNEDALEVAVGHLRSLTAASSKVELESGSASGEVKDESHSASSSRSSRSVVISAPPTPSYRPVSQGIRSVSGMDSDPSKEEQDAASSKSRLLNPYATPTLKPPGHDDEGR